MTAAVRNPIRLSFNDAPGPLPLYPKTLETQDLPFAPCSGSGLVAFERAGGMSKDKDLTPKTLPKTVRETNRDWTLKTMRCFYLLRSDPLSSPEDSLCFDSPVSG